MFIQLDKDLSRHYNSLVHNYLNEESYTRDLYNLYPTKKNILVQTKTKLKNYKNREILVRVLKEQNKNLKLSEKQEKNLALLSAKNTATITTGHQLNILTGPIYFIYKILQTIKLADNMNLYNKKYHYVPIYWMASEDHDFLEVNHFYFNETKFEWKKSSKGSVGEISTEGLDKLFYEFFKTIPDSKNKTKLVELIQNAYFNNKTNLAEATRKLVHDLFKEYGLLILDGDDKNLKQLMVSYFKDEIENQSIKKYITQTNLQIPKKEQQAHAREINLFYKDINLRERIVQNENRFLVNNHQELSFIKEEILKLIEIEPAKFSPNVLMRPLYQEVAIPNVAYVGGSGEIAYWLQLKAYFDSQKIDFPILIPRDSFLLVSKKQKQKLDKLTISISKGELFLNDNDLIKKKVKELTNLKIDFEKLKKETNTTYLSLLDKAKQTDKTFGNLILAQHKKQLNAIEKLEKRFIKAEIRKHKEIADRIKNIKLSLFPDENLQERKLNFSEIYLNYGINFLDQLYNSMKPIHFKFNIKIFD